jgi:hypothetical protein
LPEQNWLDRCLVLVRLDRTQPQGFYLAKTYNTTAAYWEETHGIISSDGTKVVWVCNWNKSIGAEKVFLMQLDMPGNWKELTAAVSEPRQNSVGEFQLYQNWPNPFNSSTTIRFSIPKRSSVTMKIFDTLGRTVAAVVEKEFPPGGHSVSFNAENLPSGVYYYQIKAGEYMQMKKLLLLK